MSVGGIVVDVYDDKDLVRVTVKDTTYGDRVQVRLEKGHDIKFGDSLWWCHQSAYWTPADKSFEDRPIKKIANSARPKGENNESKTN